MTHPPRHQLELLLAEPVEPALRAHVDGCDACAARVKAMQAARAAFLDRRDPESFARRVKPRPRRHVAIYALAVAALVSLVWMRGDETIRYKGAPLRAFVQRQGQPEALADGQSLVAGEQLAFVYSLAEPRHLLLLSIDEAGTVSRYYATDRAPLEPAARAQLPVGVELDAHRGQERIVALFSREPLDQARAEEAVRAAWRDARARGAGIAEMGRVALPAEQASVWFRKP